MVRRLVACVSAVLLVTLVSVAGGWSDDRVITMSTTTSTQSSGLLDVLLPELEKDTGIKVKVIAKGTGAAIRDGMDGNVDIIFVHALARETAFVEQGFGTRRYPVMHNDFVLIGPAGDPAGIKGMTDGAAALQKIARAKAPFISRGDDSGTHTKEQALWRASGLELAEPTQTIVKKGKQQDITSLQPAHVENWYLSIGQGMGKTITFADEKRAYTLADRGTYINYRFGKTPPVELEVLCEGGDALTNPYGIIPVSPEKHPHVKHELAMQFVRWLTGERGQGVIGAYRLEGQQLFYPDVGK